MSKAFTKENDDAEDGDEIETADFAIPAGSKNYMTPSCAVRLKAELKELLHTTRPEVVRTVSWAASNGDRSENGDYIYGKRRLREIDRRIRFLTKRLDRAEVIDPATQSSDRVLFGASVTVELLDSQDDQSRSRQYSIVGIDESDPQRNRVSWISPLARALLGSQVGDVVTLRTPKGEEELEVLKIEYKPID